MTCDLTPLDMTCDLSVVCDRPHNIVMLAPGKVMRQQAARVARSSVPGRAARVQLSGRPGAMSSAHPATSCQQTDNGPAPSVSGRSGAGPATSAPSQRQTQSAMSPAIRRPLRSTQACDEDEGELHVGRYFAVTDIHPEPRTKNPAYSIQHIAHSTQHAAHSTHHTSQATQQDRTQQTAHMTQVTAHIRFHTVHNAQYLAPCNTHYQHPAHMTQIQHPHRQPYPSLASAAQHPHPSMSGHCHVYIVSLTDNILHPYCVRSLVSWSWCTWQGEHESRLFW